MTVLFAAGDPGGANAVRPVISAHAEGGGKALVLLSGAFASGQGFPAAADTAPPPGPGDMDAFLVRHGISAICFGTSLKDTVPLALARAARSGGKRVVCVLDNWANYLARLAMDGGPPLIPDIYAVMDERARDEAMAEGVPARCLKVTGHPNLGALETDWRGVTQDWRDRFRRDHGLGEAGRSVVAFMNEPAAKDQGTGPGHPHWRGYTETGALAALCRGLNAAGSDADIAVIPHPRDDAAELDAMWNAVRAGRGGRILTGVGGRQAMMAADRVAGMASIMLYESWLVGRPTLSLQPGLVREDLLSIATRPGVVLARTEDGVEAAVERWLSLPQQPARPDLARHRQAARTVAAMLMS